MLGLVTLLACLQVQELTDSVRRLFTNEEINGGKDKGRHIISLGFWLPISVELLCNYSWMEGKWFRASFIPKLFSRSQMAALAVWKNPVTSHSLSFRSGKLHWHHASSKKSLVSAMLLSFCTSASCPEHGMNIITPAITLVLFPFMARPFKGYSLTSRSITVYIASTPKQQQITIQKTCTAADHF